MLCSLFKGQDDLKKTDNVDLVTNYNLILEAKRKMTQTEIAHIDCKYYNEFISKVFALKFEDKPDYDDLMILLK